MTIKCFKVGQAVVIAGDGGAARASRKGRTEAVVTKVGRKYVTVMPVGGGYETKYREGDSERLVYLIEETDIGSPRLLLPSVRAADAYYEAEELRLWLVRAAGWDGVHRYSLEQLREVKRILERVRPENGPLTLFELECMIGERVWVEGPEARENGRYAVVEGVNHEGQVLIVESGFPHYNYGELGACQAYREKPEDERHETD